MKSFLFIFLAAAVASAAPQPFNILFVLSDDHSAPHMACYGDPNVVTPNFDRFATESADGNKRVSGSVSISSQSSTVNKTHLIPSSP